MTPRAFRKHGPEVVKAVGDPQNGGDPKMGKGPKPSGVPARLAHIVKAGPKFKYFAAVEIEEDICNGEAKKMHPRAIYYAKKAREADRRGRPTDAASYRRLVDRHRHGASA